MAAGVTDATLSTVTVSPAVVAADDTAEATIVVTCLDDASDPVEGHTVSLAATANGTDVTIDPATAETDENGVATFTATSSAIHYDANPTEFTATDDDDEVTITDTAEVEFLGVITATPSSIGASMPGNQPLTRSRTVALTVTGTPENSGDFSLECTDPRVTVPETAGDGEEVDVVFQLPDRRPGPTLAKLATTIDVSADGYGTIKVPYTLRVLPGGPAPRR